MNLCPTFMPPDSMIAFARSLPTLWRVASIQPMWSAVGVAECFVKLNGPYIRRRGKGWMFWTGKQWVGGYPYVMRGIQVLCAGFAIMARDVAHGEMEQYPFADSFHRDEMCLGDAVLYTINRLASEPFHRSVLHALECMPEIQSCEGDLYRLPNAVPAPRLPAPA
jgi:hypothetical protein